MSPHLKRMRKHVRDAIYVVKKNIDDNPLGFSLHKINDLTINHQLYISKNILRRGFKQLFGSSLKNYEKRKRLEAALPMLEEGRLTLAQVAAKCGYASQSSFSRAFKEVFKITPTEYQFSTFNQ